MRRQIAGARMRHGHGGIGGQQQLRRRLAEQQRAADHQHILAGDVADIFLQQQHHARRRAGDQMRAARQQQAGIGGGERVHILGGIERIQHRGFVQMLGQRQLHQDAMHGFVGVQLAHLGQQYVLAGVGGKRDYAPI